MEGNLLRCGISPGGNIPRTVCALNGVTSMAANRLSTPFRRLLLVACFTLTGLWASESHGVVKAGGLPVPGATVTATLGDKKVVTSTDDAGFYSFADLDDGTWKIFVEAFGFVTTTRDIGVSPDVPGPEWDLKYQTLESIANPSKPEAPATAPAPAGASAPTAPATTAATAPPAPPTGSTAPGAAPRRAGVGNGPGNNATGNNGGRPSLNAALAGQGQGGGFTRLNVG